MKDYHVYLSAKRITPQTVPAGFSVYNNFGNIKTIVCGDSMADGYGLLVYDRGLSKAVMADYALTDITKLPKAILNDLGAFL
ncbi:hypothetical protein lacNasYZ03_11520 [Lactobacillus nasalidis]|uniref:Hydrolase n=1 Tax=Lactobacillus nasalidis TaxID=2797258 RepID=A0ABQ3W7Q2_9LACO|nr:hypothetical protein [Lactobacillus nasalidis]GHV97876.1 hypothetical protein lacNasYZ01_10580 [Lactobacillus nasalidis]GHW00106.1 hypothetical protein lacNasYZ02_15350 [Lactobacillus nasalidis]GHW01465.1 hypothetical protein lacNasYZ03_11520 [Lactobacillus nasalidis]